MYVEVPIRNELGDVIGSSLQEVIQLDEEDLRRIGMAYTTHGHHIPDTVKGERPNQVARCGGTSHCQKCKEEVIAFWKSRSAENLQVKAKQIVKDYVEKKFDKSDPNLRQVISGYDIYVVWFAKTLQNWKALLSTTLPDGMYYEVTYDGEKRQAYLDAYKKIENVVVPDQGV